jgi:predicted lipoprotein with Yx(FWY)xxD motif
VPQDEPAKVAAASTSLGKVLTDVKGETLYVNTLDKNGKSSCDADCLKLWVPMHTFGAPTAGAGAQASLLGTSPFDRASRRSRTRISRSTSSKETAPGDVTGQALQNSWYAVDGAGAPVKKAQ